jgi:hypothetical protein
MFFSRHKLYFWNAKRIDLAQQKHMERIKTAGDMLLPQKYDEVIPNKNLIW